jgi:hypothetical protein
MSPTQRNAALNAHRTSERLPGRNHQITSALWAVAGYCNDGTRQRGHRLSWSFVHLREGVERPRNRGRRSVTVGASTPPTSTSSRNEARQQALAVRWGALRPRCRKLTHGSTTSQTFPDAAHNIAHNIACIKAAVSHSSRLSTKAILLDTEAVLSPKRSARLRCAQSCKACTASSPSGRAGAPTREWAVHPHG